MCELNRCRLCCSPRYDRRSSAGSVTSCCWRPCRPAAPPGMCRHMRPRCRVVDLPRQPRLCLRTRPPHQHHLFLRQRRRSIPLFLAPCPNRRALRAMLRPMDYARTAQCRYPGSPRRRRRQSLKDLDPQQLLPCRPAAAQVCREARRQRLHLRLEQVQHLCQRQTQG